MTVRPDGTIEGASPRKRGRREVVATPVIETGTVFIGSKDLSFYAIDAATGRPKWSFPTGGEIYDGAVIDGDTVLFSSADGFLYALSKVSGQKKWAFETLAGTRPQQRRLPSPPVIENGVVYLTNWPKQWDKDPMKGFLYAIDVASGALRWTVSADGADPSSPPFVARDLVLFSIKKRISLSTERKA